MQMHEQADVTGTNVTYSWLLDAPYAVRNDLHGWKWLKGAGCKGCYVTNDSEIALRTAVKFKLNIKSNGTHEVHAVPMFFNKKIAELVELSAKFDPTWVEERLTLQGINSRIEQMRGV